MKDYYEILNLSKGASRKEILKKFIESSFSIQSEYQNTKSKSLEKKYIDLCESFFVLMDGGCRTIYDQLLGKSQIENNKNISTYKIRNDIKYAKDKGKEYLNLKPEEIKKDLPKLNLNLEPILYFLGSVLNSY